MKDLLAAAKLLTNGRDKREPKRKEKELAELKLQSAFNALFRRQRKMLSDRLRLLNSERKASTQYDDIFNQNDDTVAAIARLLLIAAQDGVDLFEDEISFDFDDSLTNAEASRWAQDYAYNLVKGIDDTTRKALRSAISQFVDTPAMTIQDVMDQMPFDSGRALKIAVTEITRAYAQGQRIAGRELKKQFPDVKVTKKWFTNNDDRVCEICAPLDGQEVELDEDYDSEGTKIDEPPAHISCRCWQSTGTKL